MRYRALVGIKGTVLTGKGKSEREKYHVELMKTLLRQWDSSVPIQPYWDPWYKTDEVYQKLLQRGANFGEDINLDNPLEVMNYIGKNTGHVFYTAVPAEDRKVRDHKKREYDNEVKKYKKQHKKIPPEVKAKESECVEPVPAEKTRLYAYCRVNPNGMFTSYCYPIQHSYNGIDVESSKLVNRNYGTMHDILLLGDLDFEATYLPSVVFRNDGEIYEGDDPDEISEFLYETLGRQDYVALIECEA